MRQLITDLTGGPCPSSATDGDVKPRDTSLVEKAPQYAFGEFGGRYIPETLVQAHDELEKAYSEAIADPAFIAEVARYRKEYIGGPTMTYHAKRLTELCGGAQIWLKREELAHTGAHKINNAIGQARCARRAPIPLAKSTDFAGEDIWFSGGFGRQRERVRSIPPARMKKKTFSRGFGRGGEWVGGWKD